jgi:hypothetical protein
VNIYIYIIWYKECERQERRDQQERVRALVVLRTPRVRGHAHTHTHARTCKHARNHAHARTHARTHARIRERSSTGERASPHPTPAQTPNHRPPPWWRAAPHMMYGVGISTRRRRDTFCQNGVLTRRRRDTVGAGADSVAATSCYCYLHLRRVTRTQVRDEIPPGRNLVVYIYQRQQCHGGVGQ